MRHLFYIFVVNLLLLPSLLTGVYSWLVWWDASLWLLFGLVTQEQHFLQGHFNITFGQHRRNFMLMSIVYNQVKYLTGLKALLSSRRTFNDNKSG